MSVLSALTSLFAGGVTGLLGNSIQSIFAYKTEKLKLQHELEFRKIEASARVDTADAEALSASYKDSSAITGNTKFDIIKGSIRPFLTLYLCFLTTLIYFKCSHLLNGDVILPGMALDLVTQIINTILYLTTTCILWWFGSRNRKAPK